jgi:hypothetical protein
MIPRQRGEPGPLREKHWRDAGGEDAGIAHHGAWRWPTVDEVNEVLAGDRACTFLQIPEQEY